jgi:hypothetical protein
MLLKSHADLEAIGEADPVERLLHLRQHAHRGAILRLVGPANSLHNSAEPPARIAEKVHVRLHARLDGRHVRLTEVREYVPGPVVHESKHLLALPCILADGDIKVRDVRIEGCRYAAIADVEFGGTYVRLGCLDTGVDIADLGQKVLSARYIMA